MSSRIPVSRRLLGVGVLAAAMIGLAACGASSGKSASNATVPSAAASSASPAAAKAVVMTSQNPKLGVILTDTEGHTLYTLTNAGQPVACTGMCTQIWPPLLMLSGATTPTGTNVTGLTVVAMNGGEQVAYKGAPLYRFAGDAKAGDTNGQGIISFGGTWHAATTSSAAPAPSAAPTTSPAMSGGGYGYSYGG